MVEFPSYGNFLENIEVLKNLPAKTEIFHTKTKTFLG
jgi:hypothetical protein